MPNRKDVRLENFMPPPLQGPPDPPPDRMPVDSFLDQVLAQMEPCTPMEATFACVGALKLAGGIPWTYEDVEAAVARRREPRPPYVLPAGAAAPVPEARGEPLEPLRSPDAGAEARTIAALNAMRTGIALELARQLSKVKDAVNLDRFLALGFSENEVQVRALAEAGVRALIKHADRDPLLDDPTIEHLAGQALDLVAEIVRTRHESDLTPQQKMHLNNGAGMEHPPVDLRIVGAARRKLAELKQRNGKDKQS